MSLSESTLTIDLAAIASNWRVLNARVGSAACGAVVKADAYGLGVHRVAPALMAAGCREFFVASLSEGKALRHIVGREPRIYLFSGAPTGQEEQCVVYGLVPVLISMAMLHRWVAVVGRRAPMALKCDTGMGRLGLSMEEYAQLLVSPALLGQLHIVLVMSHLACADDFGHPLNREQYHRFEQLKASFIGQPSPPRFSLANSAGISLGDDYHYDVVRPGIALYGSNSAAGDAGAMKPVVGLQLHIVQTRISKKGSSVGYGATHVFDKDSEVAVAAGGYADGLLRSLGNAGSGYVDGQRVPLIGRVSMDSVCFDITDLAGTSALHAVELLGAHQEIDQLASDAGTIAYDVLCALGHRYKRVYIDDTCESVL